MFERKKCKNCGERIKEGWTFCPKCGQKIKGRESLFRNILEGIDKDFEMVDRLLDSNFFKNSEFNVPKTSGISISITSSAGEEPKVEIRTSGECKKLELEIKKKLGIKPAMQEIEERKEKRKPKIPKITEEPETRIQTLENKQLISVKLPDVKNEDNIDVKKLEQSIEVKAFADDKTYFKLIPISPKLKFFGKRFENGILKIEIGR